MGTLCPADVRARADAERWMDWAHTFSREFQRPVFWALARTPPEKRDMKAVGEAVKKCGELLQIPEKTLCRKNFLSGDHFSMGDIPLGCHVQLWMRLPIERPAHANLTRWFERLATRAPFTKIVDTPIS